MFSPIKATEEVVQQTTTLTGFAETTEFLYEVISAKTSIPMTELMGTSAKGLNATGEGDRRAWYDRVTILRASVQNQIETMLGIVAGQDDGVFKEIHYRFNALETPTERETAEIRKATLEVAKAIIEVGGNQEQTFDWLKKLDFMGIDGVDFDAESFDGDNDPFADGEPMKMEAFSQNIGDFEEKHKRDKDGKFTSGGKDGEASEMPEEWGKEYTGVKGKAAIDLLLKEKQGFVKDAFTRDDIGGISLVWGDENMGLAHIIKRRKEKNQDLEKVLNSLEKVVSNGKLSFNQSTNRFEISTDKIKAIVSPSYRNEKIQFLLTAFEEEK